MHEHHVASTATDLTTVSTVLHLLQCPGFYALHSTEFKRTHSELVLSGRKQCMQPALKNVRPGWKKRTVGFLPFCQVPKYCFNVERIET